MTSSLSTFASARSTFREARQASYVAPTNLSETTELTSFMWSLVARSLFSRSCKSAATSSTTMLTCLWRLATSLHWSNGRLKSLWHFRRGRTPTRHGPGMRPDRSATTALGYGSKRNQLEMSRRIWCVFMSHLFQSSSMRPLMLSELRPTKPE